jgi:hypothetical protein
MPVCRHIKYHLVCWKLCTVLILGVAYLNLLIQGCCRHSPLLLSRELESWAALATDCNYHCASNSSQLNALHYTTLHHSSQLCVRELHLGCFKPRHFDCVMRRLRLPCDLLRSTQCRDEVISLSHQKISAAFHCTALCCELMQMHRDSRPNAMPKLKHWNWSHCVPQVGPGQYTHTPQACHSLSKALHQGENLCNY